MGSSPMRITKERNLVITKIPLLIIICPSSPNFAYVSRGYRKVKQAFSSQMYMIHQKRQFRLGGGCGLIASIPDLLTVKRLLIKDNPFS